MVTFTKNKKDRQEDYFFYVKSIICWDAPFHHIAVQSFQTFDSLCRSWFIGKKFRDRSLECNFALTKIS